MKKSQSSGVLIVAIILLVFVFSPPLRAQDSWDSWEVHINNVPQGWKEWIDIYQGVTWQMAGGKEQDGSFFATGDISVAKGGAVSREDILAKLAQKFGSASHSPPQPIELNQGAFTGYVITGGPNIAENRGIAWARSYEYAAHCCVTNGKVSLDIQLRSIGSSSLDYSAGRMREICDKYTNTVNLLLKSVTINKVGASASAPTGSTATPPGNTRRFVLGGPYRRHLRGPGSLPAWPSWPRFKLPVELA